MPTPAIQAIIQGAPIRVEMKAPQGPGGKSAYQVAVENGFVGTEAQWLASLVGPNTVTSATTTNFTSGNVLFANSGFVGSLSRSGIDTRTSFPNNDVTNATTTGTPSQLLRLNSAGNTVANIFIALEGIEIGEEGGDAGFIRILNNNGDVVTINNANSSNAEISLPTESGTLALTTDIVDSVTSATTSDGTANLSISNVTTATATVSSLLTANHIHGNLAGTLYTHVRTGEAVSKGDPVYVSGFHNGTGQAIVMRADASDAGKMPAIGVMDAAYAQNISSANCVIAGTITSVDTDAFSINSPVYVGDGGGFSETIGTIPQQVGIVERSNTNNGAFVVTNNKVISSADISDFATAVEAIAPNAVTSATTSDGTASLDISNLTLSQAITSGLQTKMVFTAEPTAAGDGQQIIWQWYNGGSPITTAAISSEATGSTTDKLIFQTTTGGSLGASLDLTNELATFSGSISSLGESYRTASTFTYASGAAAAHRTALGLDTLFNAKANLAGGNTFTGAQTITGASLTLQNAGTVTLALNDTSNANIPVFNLQQLGTTRGRIEGGVGLTSRLDFSVGIPLSRSMSLNQGGTQNYGVTIGRSSITANVAPPTDGLHVQGSVAIGTTSPNAAAAVDITSTTKGFLPPRMTTTQRNAIATPPAGLVIYNTTTNNLNSYSGSAWVELVDSADLGTNVATFLEIPTSANLASALTDGNGTGGGFVRAEGATLTTPTLVGTPVFNATSYTYGSGAAAAHKTALGLNSAASLTNTDLERSINANSLNFMPPVTFFDDMDGKMAWTANNLGAGGTGPTDFDNFGSRTHGVYGLRTVATAAAGRFMFARIATSAGNVAGARFRSCFAISDVTNCNFFLGFSWVGIGNVGLLYRSAFNSGQFTFVRAMNVDYTGGTVYPFTTEVPQAGAFTSGKRYIVDLTMETLTSCRIKLYIADFNLSNWTEISNAVVTLPSTSFNVAPTFSVQTLAAEIKTLWVDWVSVEQPNFIR